MHAISSRSRTCALMTSCWLIACANLAVPNEASEVTSTKQALSGHGDAFWQPLSNALVTHVFYCFDDVNPDDSIHDLISSSLSETWSAVANVEFHDERECSSADHAAEAVRVRDSGLAGFGIVSPSGTRLRGGLDNARALLSYADRSLCEDSFGFEHCAKVIAVHEFAHVLGFGHESGRLDFNPDACPLNNPAGVAGGVLRTDTLITPYDPDSIVEVGYCRRLDENFLSPQDIAGARAIYGAEDTFVRYAFSGNGVDFEVALRFEQQPAPGEANALYIASGANGEVGWRQVVDATEQWRILPTNNQQNPVVKYGDIVAIADERSRFLSANQDGWLYTAADPRAWERFIVESPAEELFPNGSDVLVNAPVRLRSEAWRTWVSVRENGDLIQTDDEARSVWRINGPFTSR